MSTVAAEVLGPEEEELERSLRPRRLDEFVGQEAVKEQLGGLAGRVEVASFDGLTVDFARRLQAGFIVRGLRAVSDFESEMQMAHTNRKLAPEVDTIFFMTALEHAYLSSSLVKEIAGFGGDVSLMVPGSVVRRLSG